MIEWLFDTLMTDFTVVVQSSVASATFESRLRDSSGKVPSKQKRSNVNNLQIFFFRQSRDRHKSDMSDRTDQQKPHFRDFKNVENVGMNDDKSPTASSVEQVRDILCSALAASTLKQSEISESRRKQLSPTLRDLTHVQRHPEPNIKAGFDRQLPPQGLEKLVRRLRVLGRKSALACLLDPPLPGALERVD